MWQQIYDKVDNLQSVNTPFQDSQSSLEEPAKIPIPSWYFVIRSETIQFIPSFNIMCQGGGPTHFEAVFPDGKHHFNHVLSALYNLPLM